MEKEKKVERKASKVRGSKVGTRTREKETGRGAGRGKARARIQDSEVKDLEAGCTILMVSMDTEAKVDSGKDMVISPMASLDA